jgi:folate-binding protein YgfZ
MTGDIRRIDHGMPALFEFRGPDALRYLNGQLTQDVRRVADGKQALPSCVTDAKGRLLFRVWLAATPDGAFRIDGPADLAAELEARLTRYLIADDVEVADLTGRWSLVHFLGSVPQPPAGVLAFASQRHGQPGSDWWIPAGLEVPLPADVPPLEGAELEAFRIARGIPQWGRELTEGLLPPEAGLDATDISYQKGCYIGQEVISRIKSAGKLNKRLVRLRIDATLPTADLKLLAADGSEAGTFTSISPLPDGNIRAALAFVRRGMDGPLFAQTSDGSRCEARPV